MRAPNDDTITQFDLHDCEKCSLIKIDLLSVEYLDKLHLCIDLLQEYNYIQPEETIRQTYEKYIGIYNIEREDQKMWQMVWEHKIQSLFQMEQQSGIQGIALTHPKTVEELATLNSVIRLQAEEKGAEQPLSKYTRFKNNPNLWIEEMDKYMLSEHEKEILNDIVGDSFGIAECQEKIMLLVQLPECGGYNLGWADKLRKSVAKKDPAQYEALQKEFFENAREKKLNINFCKYVWNVLIAMSRGYSFCLAHTLSYSLAALQEMNLAYKYPIILWDTACLINDSGGIEVDENETKSVDYKKIAVAIGKMKNSGISIVPPDINNSKYTFTPDVENNRISFGLSGITNVGEEIIQTTINNRPYISVLDYYNKVKPKKQSMISLIKAGAFDNLEPNRKFVMAWYIWETCDKKSKLTLQNMPTLIKNNLIPNKTEEDKRAFHIYEFNRYLKSKCKYNSEIYKLDDRALNFLTSIDYDIESFELNVKKWEKYYSNEMDYYRNWLKNNKNEILQRLNDTIFIQDWNKYAIGSYSKWEMDSLCYYYHPHELININKEKYGIVDFNKLPEQPIPVKSFKKGGRIIDMYNLVKISGTCIAKNKNKGTVTILTTDNVVTIKLRKEQFAFYDKQISEKDSSGKKKVLEKSWFTKGNMIIVQGIRRNNEFIAKKYKSTPGHTIYKINTIKNNGELELSFERG